MDAQVVAAASIAAHQRMFKTLVLLADLPLFIFFYSDPASVGAWRRQLGTIATKTVDRI